MAELFDLPCELFQIIILFLVNSTDGAQSFARAMSVSRKFLAFKDDQKVLKGLSFDTVSIANRVGIFYRSSSMLFKCAEAGNLSAQYLISKVLFVSSSHLFRSERLLGPSPLIQTANLLPNNDDTFLAAWFLDRVDHKEAGCHHWELVRNFLRRCTPEEIIDFGEHLSCHVRYFTEQDTSQHTLLYRRVDGMVMFGRDIVGRARVNLNETRRKIHGKYYALRQLKDLRNKTRGASSSYSVADVLMKEIASLQSKVENLVELRRTYPSCGSHEKDPSVYFEKCRIDALQALEAVSV